MEGLSDDVLKERRAGRNINLAAKWREFDTRGVCPESPAGHHRSSLSLCTLIRLTNAPAIRQPEQLQSDL